MNTAGVRGTVEVLLAADLDTADRDTVAGLVLHSRQLRSWLDAVDVRCARRTRALAAEGRAEPPESLLGDDGRRSRRDAADVSGREQVCEAMASFETALANGDVSAGHIDAIAAATRNLDENLLAEFHGAEADLLAAAGEQRVEAFERTCRDKARDLVAASNAESDADELNRQREQSRLKRWRDKITGMCHTHLELDPVRDANLKSAYDAHLRRLLKLDGNTGTPWHQLEVQAFLNAIEAGVTRPTTPPHGSPVGGGAGDPVATSTAPTRTGAPAEGASPNSTSAFPATPTDSGWGATARPGRPEPLEPPRSELRVPEITVLISLEYLLGQAAEHGICETDNGMPIPISTIRRLCCDAEILPAVLNGNGEVTDLGRSKRTINRAQRRQLRAMHRTCGNPMCSVGFDVCRIHHIRHWTKHHGPTDIDNLLPLCERCHHMVHEGGWTLTMTPDRVATWTRPDGTHHHTGTTVDRTGPQAPPGRAA
jgi:hypothetical protein